MADQRGIGCPHSSTEAGLNWGALLPGNSQRKLLTTRGSSKGFCYQRWGGDAGGSGAEALSSLTAPGLAHLPTTYPCLSHLAPHFPAGDAVSVYKDLGMMSPFLPDLQLFLLMLCCLGGPLWGENLPCAPTSLPQCPPPQASLFHVVNTPWGHGGIGAQARETMGGWEWGWG